MDDRDGQAVDECADRKGADAGQTAEIFIQGGAAIRNNLRLLAASSVILASLAIGYTMWALSSVMVPLVLAFVLSYLVSPVARFFRDRLHLGHVIGVILAMLVATAVMGLVGYIIFYSVSEAIEGWPTYQDRLQGFVGATIDWLRARGFIDKDPVGRRLLDLVPGSGGFVMSAFGKVLGWGGSLFTVMLFVFFMLLGRPIRGKIGRGRLISEIDEKVKTYLLVKSMVSVFTGILVGAALSFIGLDLAILFGVLAFLLNFVPTFGSIVATIVPFLMAIVQFDTMLQPILVLVIPAAIQVTIGNVIEPRIMGERLDIHPVVILFSLVMWGLIWGVPGMLMAAPLTAVLKIIFSHIDTLKPVARIIEGRLP